MECRLCLCIPLWDGVPVGMAVDAQGGSGGAFFLEGITAAKVTSCSFTRSKAIRVTWLLNDATVDFAPGDIVLHTMFYI